MQAIEVKRVNWRIDDDLMAAIARRADAAQTSQNAIANTLLREAIEGQQERPETPIAAPARVDSDVLDALAEIENAARLAHLAAEAALQAVAYQRDHPNLAADEIVRHARRAAHHRLNPPGGPA